MDKAFSKNIQAEGTQETDLSTKNGRTTDTAENTQFTSEEVFAAIKSPGPNDINNKILKNGGMAAVEELTKLFKKIIKEDQELKRLNLKNRLHTPSQLMFELKEETETTTEDEVPLDNVDSKKAKSDCDEKEMVRQRKGQRCSAHTVKHFSYVMVCITAGEVNQ
ncbi:hypothetical protein ILUMI_11297 [Ignelater luminosus]|uniref:Uncharacterized protein n=1 Tax=Ignelater luminosus TaxID=2038154 RepID=A0A8K0D0D8_IGNLU|nr:hypothetical protein ILUMI_11297 [Ignelater luminosus]